MRNTTFVSFLLVVFVTMDIYVFQGVKVLTGSLTPSMRKFVHIAYWSLTALVVGSILVAFLINFDKWNKTARVVMMGLMMVSFFTKFFFLLFVLVDDVQRGVRWVVQKIGALFSKDTPAPVDDGISRSEFLLKAGLVAASVPLVGMTWGIVSGAHDYRVRRQKLVLPNLPSAFHGLRILQLSDIHSGSFYNKTAVKGGIEKVMREKADLVFFTGDLVNNESSEMRDYMEVFEKIKAPLGVYSTLGNHDYGDYVAWPSMDAKQQNLNDMLRIHKNLGWDLLMNENRIIKQGGDQLAIIGVENWGAKARFPKYGRLEKASLHTDDAAVKVLLSHDPSHWDAQVRTQYPEIDLMFAGHTHGMQAGIDTEVLKWSPAQYVYDQWAGLYSKGNQHLYVNRGFGYIGFPGRIGILPEITVIELVKG